MSLKDDFIKAAKKQATVMKENSQKRKEQEAKEERLSKARKIAREQAYKKAYSKELISAELKKARKQAREDAKLIVSTSDEPARTTRTRMNTGAPILNRGFAPASPFVKKR
jgi:pilus assembly protein TadC